MGNIHTCKGGDGLHERLVAADPVGIVERMGLAIRKAHGKIAGNRHEGERARSFVDAREDICLVRRIGAPFGGTEVRRSEHVVGRPLFGSDKRAARVRLLQRQLRVRRVEVNRGAHRNSDRDDDDHRDDAHRCAAHPAFPLGALDVSALVHAAGIGAIVLSRSGLGGDMIDDATRCPTLFTIAREADR